MESESPESGLEELIRLQKKINRTGENITRTEQERAKREKELANKTSEVMQGLTQIKISVALQQLEPVATPQIMDRVRSLANTRSTRDLRNLVLDLANEVETGVHSAAEASPRMAPIESSVKTLTILLELLFALEYRAE